MAFCKLTQNHFRCLSSKKLPPCTIERTSKRHYKDAMAILQTTFAEDEPFMKSLGIAKCKSNHILDESYRDTLKENLSFHAACSNHLGDQLVGIALNKRNYSTDAAELSALANQIDEPQIKLAFQCWSRISQELDLHKKYSQDCIFEINTLVVASTARSQGLGAKLISNSLDLARNEHFKLVRIDCTNCHTAIIAKKLGMQLESEMPFKQLHANCIAEPPNDKVQVFIKMLCK